MNTIYIILTSTAFGFLCRYTMVKVDYRQYPSYPQAYFSHLMLGFIAALLGAVFIPAILNKEYTAVTVLTVAASQFREIREVERTSLTKLDDTEIVKRGAAYIEDIAKKFESRNYASILVSLLSCAMLYIFNSFLNVVYNITITSLISFWIIFLLNKLMKSKSLNSIADIVKEEIIFDGQFMKVNDIVVSNFGLESSREIVTETAYALRLHPHNTDGINIISNSGQRQAILHNICARLGIRKDNDEPEFTPMAKRIPETGDIVIVFMPIIRDYERILAAVKETPILESAKH